MTKGEYAWARLGVPLVWLAELDNVSAPNVLADAFGDGYLYRHNPVYAGVRDSAVGAGCRFSAADTPLWRDYQSFSLTALAPILSTRKIPYLDTGTTFRRLIEANPRAVLPLSLISSLRSNYTFHEAAHCVAHSIMARLEGELDAAAPRKAGRFVLEAILAESFANTVEALGSTFRHMPAPDHLFYRLNSYYSCDSKREKLMNGAGEELGVELRFTLLLFSYFEANLATGAPTDLTYERVAEAGKCLSSQAGLAQDITRTGFDLSLGFRENTTPAYFEFFGYSREYAALANAGWLGDGRNGSLARPRSPVLGSRRKGLTPVSPSTPDMTTESTQGRSPYGLYCGVR